MTPDHIRIIRSTFARVYATPDEAGRLFYTRLFALAPDTRVMFKADIGPQARKLVDTLTVAVAGLRDPASLAPMLERLGRNHAGLGVTPRHYEVVGRALLDTLSEALGPDFTPEAREAWATLYRTVSTTMQNAATSRAAA